METRRLSSGLTAVDAILEGGFPHGAVISLLGRTGSSKHQVVLHFSAEGDNSLYITTKESVSQLILQAKQFNLELHDLTFLDAVHWRIRRVNPNLESSAEYSVSNLTDLNALLAKIMKACTEKNIGRLVFDSPTSLLLYSTPGTEQVYKFFELLTAFTRSHGITMMYTLEQGVHPDDIIATMHYLSDGVILCQNQTLRIEHMSLTSYSDKEIKLQ